MTKPAWWSGRDVVTSSYPACAPFEPSFAALTQILLAVKPPEISALLYYHAGIYRDELEAHYSADTHNFVRLKVIRISNAETSITIDIHSIAV